MLMAYSPEEILRIAVDVENNGARLYEQMSKSCIEKNRSVFLELAKQEKEHSGKFAALLESLGQRIYKDETEDTYEQYFRAIASEYIFSTETIDEMLRKKDATFNEMLDFAIGVEKTSILAYKAVRNHMLDAGPSVLDKIIEEEQSHYVLLSGMK